MEEQGAPLIRMHTNTRSMGRRKKKVFLKRLKEYVQESADLECQLSWLAPFVGITVLLGVIVLPGVALIGFDKGWAVSRGPSYHMHIGNRT